MSLAYDMGEEGFEPLSTRRSVSVRVLIPAGPETLWPAIRKVGMRGTFTAIDVALAVSSSHAVVENYLAKLHAAGHVTKGGHTSDGYTLWQLTSKRHYPPYVNGRGEPAHGHEVTSRIWRALKMMKRFTISELCAHLDDKEFQVPRDAATLYVNALARAGYVETTSAEKMCGESRYRLLAHMVTGPLPPRLLRAQIVFDPNRQAIAGGQVQASEVSL
jgi:hypothetical protein